MFLKIMLKKDKLKNVKPVEIPKKVVVPEVDDNNIDIIKDWIIIIIRYVVN